MGKSYFFLGAVRTHPEDKRRVTSGNDYRVYGGSKEKHQKTVELCQELSKEFEKDPPQTPGEARMIMRDVVRKVGS